MHFANILVFLLYCFPKHKWILYLISCLPCH